MNARNIYKKTPGRYHGYKAHNSFGIQNWLVSKKYCITNTGLIDIEKYNELLKAYYFDHTGKENPFYPDVESYIQGRFHGFTKYVKKNLTPVEG